MALSWRAVEKLPASGGGGSGGGGVVVKAVLAPAHSRARRSTAVEVLLEPVTASWTIANQRHATEGILCLGAQVLVRPLPKPSSSSEGGPPGKCLATARAAASIADTGRMRE